MSGFEWLPSEVADAIGGEGTAAQNAAMHREDAIRQINKAKLFYDVFGNGRGPELLEHLRAETIEVSLLMVEGPPIQSQIALSPEQWAFIREGQNSMVRHIERQMRIAVMPIEDLAQPEEAPESE